MDADLQEDVPSTLLAACSHCHLLRNQAESGLSLPPSVPIDLLLLLHPIRFCVPSLCTFREVTDLGSIENGDPLTQACLCGPVGVCLGTEGVGTSLHWPGPADSAPAVRGQGIPFPQLPPATLSCKEPVSLVLRPQRFGSQR